MSRLGWLMASLWLLGGAGAVRGDEKPGEQVPVSEAPPEFSVRLREDVVYGRVGERELLLDIFTPEVEGPVPAVIVIHGGAWRSGNRKQLRGYADSLAKRGMACFAIDYRLAPEHKFPAQIDDCRMAVRWVRRHAAEYQVDAARLGAIGYSAGGHLAALLGTTGKAADEDPEKLDTRLQAIVAGGAPTEFRLMADGGKWAEYWMGGDRKAVPEKFEAASPTAFVDAKDPPFFFFNGTDDKLVPLIWSMTCHTALRGAGVRSEVYRVEGAGHLQAAMNREAIQRSVAFLATELRAPGEEKKSGQR
ncbi:MAG: alpha/beta hydrolase fold domain-containing protein [Planctomycetaceae bacterium]